MQAQIFDVGQAAWAVIELASDRLAIIDCGAGSGREADRVTADVRERLNARPETRITFLLISHFDADHCSGLATLLEDDAVRDRIDCVVCNRLEFRLLLKAVRRVGRASSGATAHRALGATLRSLLALQQLIDDRSLTNASFHRELVSPPADDPRRYPLRVKFASLPDDVDIRVFSPSQRLLDRTAKRLLRVSAPSVTLGALLGIDKSQKWNSAGVVISISAGSRRVLFPGDATSETWEEILGSLGDQACDADVVVAWHHGGRLGARKGRNYDRMVWQRVLRSSATVVISHGCDNRFGHPHADTLKEIFRCGGDVLCTQQKTSAVSPDVRHAFDFATVGMALSIDPHEPERYSRESGSQCCGDVSVEFRDDRVVVSGAQNGWLDRALRPGCCRFHP